MKRFVGLLLAICLLVVLCVPAFAVGIDGTSAYGQLGQSFSVANETVKWDGFIGHFYMNDEFLNQVLEMVEKMVSAISRCTSLK